MAVDYERIHASFKRDAGQIFENNTEYYSDNDINYLKKMNQMYGCAMSAKGLNVLDPIYSNFFHSESYTFIMILIILFFISK